MWQILISSERVNVQYGKLVPIIRVPTTANIDKRDVAVHVNALDARISLRYSARN